MDETSQYTYILNHGGIVSIPNTLLVPNYCERTDLNSLLDLLKLVLYKINFDFNEKDYLQIDTAMGSKLAHSYASLFMGQLEKKKNISKVTI
jgi:hypothetical protein